MKTLFAVIVVGTMVLAFNCNDSAAAEKTLTLKLADGVEMKLVLIPAGKFTMGSPADEKGRIDDETQHEVTITKPFYMGVYEVTQAEYQAIMGVNPSAFKDPTKPVENVSWNDAAEFCKKASLKTGKTVRLPTEAEWEYACRAGTTTRFSFGDDEKHLGEYAWHVGNSGETTHPVGGKKPNAWGLYDMHGNVWEWVADWYEPYANLASKDPQGPAEQAERWARVLRGGSWNVVNTVYFRCALRNFLIPALRGSYFGFCVARTL